MNYSALVVSSSPGMFSEMLEAIKEVEAVEVHHTDDATGRCIVIIEAEDINSEMEKFKEISALPQVVDVALVAHQFEESADIDPIRDLTQLN